MSNKNFYTILGVFRDADADTIEAAYLTLASRYGPASGNHKPALFSDISRAHQILSDPEKRAAYDDQLRSLTAPPLESRPSYTRTKSPINRRKERSQSGNWKWMITFLSALFGIFTAYGEYRDSTKSDTINYQETIDAFDTMFPGDCNPIISPCLNSYDSYSRPNLHLTLDAMDIPLPDDLNPTPYSLGIGTSSQNFQKTLEAYDVILPEHFQQTLEAFER